MAKSKKDKISFGSKLAAEHCEKTAKIIRERGKTHGDAFKNLEDIARRWTSRLRAKGYEGPDLNVVDVCYFMDEVKLSRSAFGDPMEVDHLADTMGYSAIGAAWITRQKMKEPLQVADEGAPTSASDGSALATSRSTEDQKDNKNPK